MRGHINPCYCLLIYWLFYIIASVWVPSGQSLLFQFLMLLLLLSLLLMTYWVQQWFPICEVSQIEPCLNLSLSKFRPGKLRRRQISVGTACTRKSQRCAIFRVWILHYAENALYAFIKIGITCMIIWKPDPLEENPIIVYLEIYAVYLEIYENLISHNRISRHIRVWAKTMTPKLGTVLDFFYHVQVWICAQAPPMTVHRMVESKMKKQCEEKEFG